MWCFTYKLLYTITANHPTLTYNPTTNHSVDSVPLSCLTAKEIEVENKI